MQYRAVPFAAVAVVPVALFAFLLAPGLGSESIDEPNIALVATGTGTDEASALKQAFSNAIEQAVGTIVDAEVIVRSDQVIREQILTASNAIVVRYDPVGKPFVDSGLVTVRI